ncbi:MAG: aspartate--tRNA ligase, partial [Candidatus Omnitrophota bacterium]
MLRTHTCGELRDSDVGKSVSLCGWVNARRDHGGLIFIDLRDRYGTTQVVFNPEKKRELHAKAHDLKSEYVVRVNGAVERRPKETENAKLPTGKIEISAEDFTLLSSAEVPPFEIVDNVNATEEIRLHHRYLDLRRPSMQKRIALRHKVYKLIRDYLDGRGYLEMETPILTKSTPEGARDFLVPSRLSEGAFFALPQSPQIFKQILMVGGVDKYFQIVRCFRDEDLRADRQPEFTQLDMEASFVEEEDIYEVCEGLIKEIYKGAIGADLKVPFERLSHSDALQRFGSDKPDLRFGCEIRDLTEELKSTEFKIFKKVIGSGGRIKAIAAAGAAKISLSKIDELTKYVSQYGAKGLAYLKVEEEKLSSNIAKFFKDDELSCIRAKLGAKTGDMIFIVADKESVGLESLGSLRLQLAQEMGWIDKD